MINISKFDRFDLAAGLHWYADQNHDGQWSRLYAILSASEYQPGMLETAESLDGDAAEIFQLLEQGDLDASEVQAHLTGAV